MGFWDCLECGTKSIMGLPHCPHCGALPAEEAPAAPVPESGTQEEVEQEPVATPPEPQVQPTTSSKKGGGNAKS